MVEVEKPSPVVGVLQVNSQEPLDILKKFINEEIHLRSASEKHKLQLVWSELPAFWPKLLAICNFDVGPVLGNPGQSFPADDLKL